jgi:hypothetical protein
VALAQDRHHLAGGGRVEVAGGLVGEQDARAVDERAGDRDPLLLAAREVAGTRSPASPRPSARAARRPPARLARRHAGQQRRQLDVVGSP